MHASGKKVFTQQTRALDKASSTPTEFYEFSCIRHWAVGIGHWADGRCAVGRWDALTTRGAAGVGPKLLPVPVLESSPDAAAAAFGKVTTRELTVTPLILKLAKS